MVKVLAVSDEAVESLWCGGAKNLDVDLILGAGDLPFDYLEYLTDTIDAPCVFVPGNHDIDLSGFTHGRVGWMRAGLPTRWPGPAGATNADRQVVTVAGLRIAGLGGSIRYRAGPNQWTEGQQRRRSRSVARKGRTGIDILLTHSPPLDIGDGDDPAHRGFACFVGLAKATSPQVLVHGHIHPHGQPVPDRMIDGTRVVNTVGYTLMELTPGGSGPTIVRRRHGA